MSLSVGGRVRSMCCGTPPDCEWKAQAGNVCVASFDWTCSGICKSVERIKDVHERCGEGDNCLGCHISIESLLPAILVALL